jgi:uncharacterized protein YdaU (DUF1376 family)
MNYFPFHIGDYISSTRHLTWDEDAAYRRLLDVYYTHEEPLSLDERKVFRLVMATTQEQREAVLVVLNEFFEKTEQGWVNHRADAEIISMKEKQQKQRDKANKRWNKPQEERGNATAMPRHEESDAAASKNDADAMPPTPTPTPTPTPKITKPPKPPFRGGEVVLPDCIATDQWTRWVAFRQSLKKPVTQEAAEEQIRQLVAWSLQGHDPNAILATSIRNSWQGLFEPKPTGPGNGKNHDTDNSAPAKVRRACEARRERERATQGIGVAAGDAIEGQFERIPF